MIRERLSSILTILVLAVSLAACQSTTKQAEAEAESEAAASAPAAPRVQTVTLTVPAGTELEVRLMTPLDTGKVTEGATFEGTLASPLVAGGSEVAPVGAKVAGTVTHVVSSGRLSKPAELSLRVDSIAMGGQAVAVSTEPLELKGEGHAKRNIGIIGGGAGAGAVIGGLTGGKKGAAIGGAIGAGAGTGVAAATGKKEIVLEAETKLPFKLSAPASVSVRKPA
jgi:hypothetical protein